MWVIIRQTTASCFERNILQSRLLFWASWLFDNLFRSHFNLRSSPVFVIFSSPFNCHERVPVSDIQRKTWWPQKHKPAFIYLFLIYFIISVTAAQHFLRFSILILHFSLLTEDLYCLKYQSLHKRDMLTIVSS